MADQVKDLRRLVIKAFHMTDVEWGDHNDITTDGHMTVSKEMLDQLVEQEKDYIEKIDIQIIKPGDHDRWTNTIMDIIPISSKGARKDRRGHHTYGHGRVRDPDGCGHSRKAVPRVRLL